MQILLNYKKYVEITLKFTLDSQNKGLQICKALLITFSLSLHRWYTSQNSKQNLEKLRASFQVLFILCKILLQPFTCHTLCLFLPDSHFMPLVCDCKSYSTLWFSPIQLLNHCLHLLKLFHMNVLLSLLGYTIPNALNWA